MKDASPTLIESGRPDGSPAQTVEYCLRQLYADRHKSVRDEVAKDLTYEELLGALLHARDSIQELRDLQSRLENESDD